MDAISSDRPPGENTEHSDAQVPVKCSYCIKNAMETDPLNIPYKSANNNKITHANDEVTQLV